MSIEKKTTVSDDHDISPINSEQIHLTRTPSEWQVNSSVQQAVDKYIADDPTRYRLAQRFGDFLVDHPIFSNLDELKIPNKDIAGDELQYQELCKLFKYYGIKPVELSLLELGVIERKLGSEWKEILIGEYGFVVEDFLE